jgi:hypothetical protein
MMVTITFDNRETEKRAVSALENGSASISSALVRGRRQVLLMIESIRTTEPHLGELLGRLDQGRLAWF